VFIFYDTETSGLEKDFSQIFQIALVFTDDNFNILSSKKLECRRSPWVVPSPGAMLITGFSPDDLKRNKYSHYEMMKETNDWARLQHWPVIFSGYNTFGFDEHVLAQNFQQSLLDPNLTTSGNKNNGQQNGRMDVATLVKMSIAYAPGALTMNIMNEQGYASQSLMNIASQNGVVLSAEDAHDALNDVKATIGVARVIRKLAPHVYDQCLALSTPAGVDAFIAANEVFTQAYVARAKGGGYAVTGAADGMLFDLSKDPAAYLDMTPQQLKDVLADRKSFVFRRYDKNKQPMFMPLEHSDPVLNVKFDENIARARAAAIRNHPTFRANLQAAMALAAPVKAVSPYTELQKPDLSDPVLKNKLLAWVNDFRNVKDWKQSAAALHAFDKAFAEELKADPALKVYASYARRIIFEHAPHELTPQDVLSVKRGIAARLLNPDPDVPYMTIAKARKELEGIEQERAAGREKWQHNSDTEIRALKLYYTSLEKEYAPYYKPVQPPQQPAANDDKPASGAQKPPAPAA
jgi:exodeoxyribonuclease-1